LHGSTHHMGERYAEGSGSATPRERQQATELRDQLRLAVETENFELAAELRDRLRVLE
jgi:protein arginine kinase activator